jgi:hypothetical protein
VDLNGGAQLLNNKHQGHCITIVTGIQEKGVKSWSTGASLNFERRRRAAHQLDEHGTRHGTVSATATATNTMQDANKLVGRICLMNYAVVALYVATDKYVTPETLKRHVDAIVNAPSFEERKERAGTFVRDVLGGSSDFEQLFVRASILPPSRHPLVVWVDYEMREVHVTLQEWLDYGLVGISSSLFMTFGERK